MPRGKVPRPRRLGCQTPALGATANACGRDAATAPAWRSLGTWGSLGPLALSSHVLLDMKTFPVKTNFRILLYWLMQLLTNKVCLDYTLMTNSACSNRFSLVLLSFPSLFPYLLLRNILAQRGQIRRVGCFLPEISALPGRS